MMPIKIVERLGFLRLMNVSVVFYRLRNNIVLVQFLQLNRAYFNVFLTLYETCCEHFDNVVIIMIIII